MKFDNSVLAFKRVVLGLGLVGILGAGGAAMVFPGSAGASPLVLPADSPLFIKFSNREQLSAENFTTDFGDGVTITENSWGVLRIDTIRGGVVDEPNNLIGGGDAPPIFADQLTHNAQITGIFYGLEAHPDSGGAPLASTGGLLDLYWRDVGTLGVTSLASALPEDRTAPDQFTGFTEGDFLVRLAFASGISSDPVTTLVGDILPTAQSPFSGLAAGYFNVDYSKIGAWTEALDGNWFNTEFGPRDLRFDNRYTSLASWDGDPGVVGALSDDPVQAFTTAVPEPKSIALLGLGLLALVFITRRRLTA